MRNEEWRWRLRRIIKMGDARHFCQLNYFSPLPPEGANERSEAGLPRANVRKAQDERPGIRKLE